MPRLLLVSVLALLTLGGCCGGGGDYFHTEAVPADRVALAKAHAAR